MKPFPASYWVIIIKTSKLTLCGPASSAGLFAPFLPPSARSFSSRCLLGYLFENPASVAAGYCFCYHLHLLPCLPWILHHCASLTSQLSRVSLCFQASLMAAKLFSRCRLQTSSPLAPVSWCSVGTVCGQSLSEGLSHAVLLNVFASHSSGWWARAASSVHTGGSALAAGSGFCGWNQPRSGKCLWHGSTALPQSLLPPCTPPWVSYQVLQSLIHTDMEVASPSFGLSNCHAHFRCRRVHRGRIQERDLRVWQGESGGGQMAVRVLAVLTEEGLERGAVIWPDSTHRLPAGSPSLAQRLTIRRQRTLGVTYSNLLWASQTVDVVV